MKHPYVYYVKVLDTNEYYVGSRGANTKLPEDDLGKIYFTSSRYFKSNFLDRKLEWKVVFRTSTYAEAAKLEERLYWEMADVGVKLLNRLPPNSGVYCWWANATEEAKKKAIKKANEVKAWHKSEGYNKMSTSERRKLTLKKLMEDSVYKERTHLNRSTAASVRILELKKDEEKYRASILKMLSKREELGLRHKGPADFMTEDQIKRRNETVKNKWETDLLYREKSLRSLQEGWSQKKASIIEKVRMSQRGTSNSRWRGYLVTPHGTFSTLQMAIKLLDVYPETITRRVELFPEAFYFTKDEPKDQVDIVKFSWIPSKPSRRKQTREDIIELYEQGI